MQKIKVLKIYKYFVGKLFPASSVLFNVRRLTPVSSVFGLDRGTPIDRYYIEKFLCTHSVNITGHVLEIGDNFYTKRHGTRVATSDVLHATSDNPQATIVADLADITSLPENVYDCIICTQTLPFIYDIRAACKGIHKLLKPNGVALITSSGISQISRYDMIRWGDYWRLTDLSARRLFTEYFPPNDVSITIFGNVLTAVGFLHGLAAEELKEDELDYSDENYQVIIGIRAVKNKYA